MLPPTIHATAIAIGGRAVVVVGPSGSGKSDLALRLIDRGAVLVADDRVVVERHGDRVLASAPPTISGLVEVRGVGLVAVPHAVATPVALVVDLAASPTACPSARRATLPGSRCRGSRSRRSRPRRRSRSSGR